MRIAFGLHEDGRHVLFGHECPEAEVLYRRALDNGLGQDIADWYRE